MKRIFYALVFAISALTALVGCGTDGSPMSSSASDDPGASASGGTLPSGSSNPGLSPMPGAQGIGVEASNPSSAAQPASASQPSAQPSTQGYLQSDLEDQNASCWRGGGASCGQFTGIGAGPVSLEENGIRHSGRKAMKVTFNRNEDVGGASMGVNGETIHVRTYYYFAPGFDFGQGVKIGRLTSFNSGSKTNDVDIVLEVRSAKQNQCGVTDMADLGVFYNGRPKGSDWGVVTAPISFQRGRWYAVEYQVTLNTPGSKNGTVTLWVDGAQVAQRTGLSIRGNLSSKFNGVRIGGWYSNGANGNSCANPSGPSTFYMDDVAVGKSHIGT